MPLILYFMLSFFLIQSNGSSACISTERTELLTFKSKLKDPRNLLATWKGQNCCSWEGVTCHNNSGHVVKLNLRYPYTDLYPEPDLSLNGKIDSSLLSLRNLTHLDLSGNNFNETEIPKFIGQFENLVYLNLSSTKFVGKIPTEMGNLKRLRYLDMSSTSIFVINSIPPEIGNISSLSFLSFRNGFYRIENIQWVSKLSSLQYLDLTSVDISSSTDWFYVINKLKYLKVLLLSTCQLNKIPAHVAMLNLTTLTTLDLSNNWFESPIPNWLGNLTSISYLDLSNAGFYGLGSGFWSKSKEPICHLRYLDLSDSEIAIDITYFVNEFACSWKIIEVLSLANNYFHGNLLTDWLKEMPRLTHLDLQENHLEGIVSENHLENLSQLQVLDLSSNILRIAIDRHWHPKFQLEELALQSCDVGPMFPSWLRSQTQIISLNLQNTSINDALPPWFWRPSYLDIDLSYNNLHGMLPHKLQSPNLSVLILASNNLGGPIKSLPNQLSILDISSNKFSGRLPRFSNQSYSVLSLKDNSFVGEIPSSICEMVFLYILDLSMNKLSGTIPNCMWKLKSLAILDMSFNNLLGTIPSSIGSMVNLISLILYANILTGELPRNLQYCQSLEYFGLGNNKLTGKVPTWIGVSWNNLVYLQLRQNNFSGSIPPELTLLSNLQILDIASNNLEGSIPSLGNFNVMASKPKLWYPREFSYRILSRSNYHNSYFSYNYISTLAILTKGEIFVNSIDLSGNNLSGSIPDDIGSLEALENLNLSRNNLNGKVPEKIGNIKSLESLDLSFNKLSGEIPQSMSELTFLSILNLSYNNLSGPIPIGNHLNSLNDSSIYIGNAFLCGGPLNQSCKAGTAKNYISDGKDGDSDTLWMYLSASAGFLVGWSGVWCILLLHKTRSKAFFEKVDYLYYKLFK